MKEIAAPVCLQEFDKGKCRKLNRQQAILSQKYLILSWKIQTRVLPSS
jgi:hypothetical protein